MKHPKKHTQHFIPHTRLPLGQSLLVVVAFSVMAFIGIQLLRAAGHIVSTEAESGTVAGNAGKVNDVTASGGQTVAFGHTPSAPARVKAITGGNSIAVVWEASVSPNIKNYEVYRNGSKVATITPGTGIVDMEKQGRRYIDTNVARGSTYRYQIKTVNANNSVSALTSETTVTHPTDTTPIPSISFEYIRANATAEVKNLVETYFKRELEIWYPKISDALVYPHITPPTELIVETNPDLLMGGLGQRIGYNPAEINSTSISGLAGGALLHEATHLISNTSYGSPRPTWFGEGIADWTRDFFTLERTPYVPTPIDDATLLAGGYSPGASMIGYIEKKYDASFARDLTIKVTDQDYTSSFLQEVTGKSESQLINEWRTSHAGATGPVQGITGKCLDVASGGTTNGTKLQLYTCNNMNPQKWTILYYRSEARNLSPGGDTIILANVALGARKCLDVQSAGTADGTKVHYWDCNSGEAQQWKIGLNNSLINPRSGKCLSTTGGGSEDGNQLIIASCNGSDAQRWTLPN
jgi:hypothetical protein